MTDLHISSDFRMENKYVVRCMALVLWSGCFSNFSQAYIVTVCTQHKHLFADFDIYLFGYKKGFSLSRMTTDN